MRHTVFLGFVQHLSKKKSDKSQFCLVCHLTDILLYWLLLTVSESLKRSRWIPSNNHEVYCVRCGQAKKTLTVRTQLKNFENMIKVIIVLISILRIWYFENVTENLGYETILVQIWHCVWCNCNAKKGEESLPLKKLPSYKTYRQ